MTVPYLVAASALSFAVLLVVVLVVLWRRRRLVSTQRRTPVTVWPQTIPRGPLRPEVVASLLPLGVSLPPAWQTKMRIPAADAGVGVGVVLWNRAARELGLAELVIDDTSTAGMNMENITSTTFEEFVGEARPRRSPFASFRAQRRLSQLQVLTDNVEVEDLLPQSKPWSTRGGYQEVDWRDLDLPEPVPDQFVR
jgi:hypothetical protein